METFQNLMNIIMIFSLFMMSALLIVSVVFFKTNAGVQPQLALDNRVFGSTKKETTENFIILALINGNYMLLAMVIH